MKLRGCCTKHKEITKNSSSFSHYFTENLHYTTTNRRVIFEWITTRISIQSTSVLGRKKVLCEVHETDKIKKWKKLILNVIWSGITDDDRFLRRNEKYIKSYIIWMAAVWHWFLECWGVDFFFSTKNKKVLISWNKLSSGFWRNQNQSTSNYQLLLFTISLVLLTSVI